MNYINPTISAKGFYNKFHSEYPDINVEARGGVPEEKVLEAFSSCGFNAARTTDFSSNTNCQQIAVIRRKDNGRSHAVIFREIHPNSPDKFIIHDPSQRKDQEIERYRLLFVIKIEK